jgi:hypothetical protein
MIFGDYDYDYNLVALPLMINYESGRKMYLSRSLSFNFTNIGCWMQMGSFFLVRCRPVYIQDTMTL